MFRSPYVAWSICTFLTLANSCLSFAVSRGDAPSPALQSIESAIQAASSSTQPVPVVVRGIVILNGHHLIIEDRTGATEVKPTQTEVIALGDEVEVTGRMSVVSRRQIMQGQLRRLWGGSMPPPLSITPDKAADGENELSLVQTEAVLLNASPAGLTGVQLNFRGGYQNFAAILPNGGLNEELPANLMQPGARLRLTGILFVNHDPNGNRDEAFSLELRTLQDVELVEGPSWWTRGHIALLAGVFVVLILISLNLYSRLNHARYRAVAEERASIARDIHDTLAQAFAGMTLQLEAAERTIARDPVQSRAFLKEALQMARHSRNESHLSIEILHSLSRNERLEALISNCISKMHVSTGFLIEQKVSGEPASLSYQVVNNLFRIGQEAIANSVQHSNATQVTVRISYGKKEVLLEVEDNGDGFDPGQTPGTDHGHFGLTGMRERAVAIGSTLQLDSTPSGTRMSVRVPA